MLLGPRRTEAIMEFWYGLFLGLLIAAGVIYSWRDYLAIKLNDQLRADLKHADEEIKRIRAWMALHVGEEKS
jgi:hypothetical protein